jgi:hypothetical protein
MERWNGGTVERWNGGTVERWNGGTVERWYGGTVVRWYGGTVAMATGCHIADSYPQSIEWYVDLARRRVTGQRKLPAQQRMNGAPNVGAGIP